MKRFLIILMAVLITVTGFSQIPKSYERKIKRQTRKVERLKKDHDIVLEPGESIPLPESYSSDQKSLENWGVEYLQAPQFRDKIKDKEGKRNVLIVEFDTGGEILHPTLLKALLKGFSYTGEPLKDEHGHATHVAGIMVSEFANIGVAESLIDDGHVKVLPAKILHNQGWGDKPEIIAGVTDILNHVQSYLDDDWFVIFTNSWGGSQLIPELVDLYKKAEEKGILVLAASGNNGSGQVGYPAAIESVISVGALQQDPNGEVSRASYSQYGPKLDFVAPGSKIYSTWKAGGFAFLNGTSMATPQQAALFAILASYFPESTAADLKAHFKKYAKDFPPDGKDLFTGYGASLLEDLINNEPEKIGDNPDDPEDPIEDPEVIKRERVITIPLENLDMVWGIGSFNDQRPLKVDLILNVTSTKLAEVTHDKTQEIALSFFGRTGLMFSDVNADVYDASEWTARFFHRHANKQDVYKVGIKEITVKDEKGRIFKRYGEDLKIAEKVRFEDIPTLIQLK